MDSADSSANSPTPLDVFFPNFTQPISLKLEGPNYISWLSHVVPVIRRNDLMGFIDGEKTCPPQLLYDENGQNVPNPNYTLWIRKDQFLLSWIISTLSEKVLSQVYGLDTSRLIWVALQNKFASQSQSRISHIKRQLQCLRQGSKTCSEYITDSTPPLMLLSLPSHFYSLETSLPLMIFKMSFLAMKCC
jgi:hypothetical protein